jgi:hypothetical protein
VSAYDQIFAFAPHLLSVIAIIVAMLSWRAAEKSARATAYERRFDVYRDAEVFVRAWIQLGGPNLDHLGGLVDAWNRSHFLFDSSVTAFLRDLWLKALSAHQANLIVSGELEGDRDAAIKLKYDLLNWLGDESSPLRRAFIKQLKI